MSGNEIRVAYILLYILSIDFLLKSWSPEFLKNLHLFIYLLKVYVSVPRCMYFYHMCADAQGCQKRTLNSLELDLQAVVRHGASAKNQILIFFQKQQVF